MHIYIYITKPIQLQQPSANTNVSTDPITYAHCTNPRTATPKLHITWFRSNPKSMQ